MNNQSTREIPQIFLATLAQSLSDAFSQITGSEWKLTPQMPAEHPPETGTPPPADRDTVVPANPEAEEPAGPVCFKLDFAGALEGGLTLQMVRAQAVSLAAQILGETAETVLLDFNQQRSEALLAALRAALQKWAAMLNPQGGELSVQASIGDEFNDSPAAASSFEVREAGSAGPPISVRFSSALAASLAKASETAATQTAPLEQESPPSPPAMNSAPPPPAAKMFDEAQLGLVMDVELNVTLRFGQRQLSLREIMELSSGSVIELDRQVDEPVELLLDGKVIARGEAVIVDGNYGLRVTEISQPMKPLVN